MILSSAAGDWPLTGPFGLGGGGGGGCFAFILTDISFISIGGMDLTSTCIGGALFEASPPPCGGLSPPVCDIAPCGAETAICLPAGTLTGGMRGSAISTTTLPIKQPTLNDAIPSLLTLYSTENTVPLILTTPTGVFIVNTDIGANFLTSPMTFPLSTSKSVIDGDDSFTDLFSGFGFIKLPSSCLRVLTTSDEFGSITSLIPFERNSSAFDLSPVLRLLPALNTEPFSKLEITRPLKTFVSPSTRVATPSPSTIAPNEKGAISNKIYLSIFFV